MGTKILDKASATGDDVWIEPFNAGKQKSLHCTGTFDGATIGLQVRLQSSADYSTITEATFLSASSPVTLRSGGFFAKGTVTDAGSSTAVTLELQG